MILSLKICKGLNYENMVLFSLKQKIKDDTFEVLKMGEGFDILDTGKLFPPLDETRTRRHDIVIRARLFSVDVRNDPHTQRVSEI